MEMIYKKKNNILALVAILSLILLNGCIDTHYVGRSYAPIPESQKINFYNKNQPVPEDKYQPIGRAVTTAPDSYSSEDIKKAILAEARKHGADAVRVVDFKRVLIDRQTIPRNSIADDGPTGRWRSGRRADGSKFAVNPAGDVVPMRSDRYDRYQLKARVIFLRLKTKMSKSETLIKKMGPQSSKTSTADNAVDHITKQKNDQ